MKNWILLSVLIALGNCYDIIAQVDLPTEDPEGTSMYFFVQAEAHFLTKLDSAIHYLELGIPYYKKRKNWNNYLNCLNGLSSCHYMNLNLQQSIHFAKVALDGANKYLGKKNGAYLHALNNYAQLATEKGSYEEAIPLFLEAWEASSAAEQQDYAYQITLLGNIGSCYGHKGDHGEAISYFNKALQLDAKNPKKNPLHSASTLNKLADAFSKKMAYDTAVTLQQRAINIYENTRYDDSRTVQTKKILAYNSLAHHLSKLGRPKDFKNTIQKAISLGELNDDPFVFYSYYQIGNWQLDQKNYSQASKSYQKALEAVGKKYDDYNTHPEIGKIYKKLGDLDFQTGSYTSSLAHFEKALHHFSKGLSTTNSNSDLSSKNLLHDDFTIELLHARAKTLAKMSDTASNPLPTFHAAIDIANAIRDDFHTNTSKEKITALVPDIIEDALASYLQGTTEPQTLSALDTLFQIVESGKATMLLESFRDNRAKFLGGLPKDLTQKEISLQQELFFYEKAINEEQRKATTNEQKIQSLSLNIFDAKQRHQKLIKHLEANYPEYYSLKYQQKNISISEVQRNLPKNGATFVEYFLGENHIYAFVISRTNAKLVSSKKPTNFEEIVFGFKGLIQRPPQHDQAYEDFQKFTHYAHDLYRQLIASLQLSADQQELIIITDGILGYLPFEVFIQQPVLDETPNYSSRHLNYLINDYRISYNYSAAIWGQEYVKNPSIDFLGFAPSFNKINTEDFAVRSCANEDLYELKCNESEISAINKLIKGKVLMGAAASKNAFMEQAAQAKIIHLATHACLDEDNPMMNKIHMTDNYISNYDLYNLKLEAELAVLSACNTGNGTLQKGEGVMSIFRGFLQAGCPSSLISLWSVEDCTTKSIMQEYYGQLKAGQTKDMAIQQAKKIYLENTDRLHAHPFYWAPFVQFGATAPIFEARPFYAGLLWLFPIIGLGLIWIVRNKFN